MHWLRLSSCETDHVCGGLRVNFAILLSSDSLSLLPWLWDEWPLIPHKVFFCDFSIVILRSTHSNSPAISSPRSKETWALHRSELLHRSFKKGDPGTFCFLDTALSIRVLNHGMPQLKYLYPLNELSCLVSTSTSNFFFFFNFHVVLKQMINVLCIYINELWVYTAILQFKTHSTNKDAFFFFSWISKTIKICAMLPYKWLYFFSWDAEEKHTIISTLEMIN